MEREDPRTIELLLDNRSYVVEYQIHELVDGWFTLTIWYRGKSISERVPVYTSNLRGDVEMPHGPMLLQRLLELH
jgi:hypothetical protein